MMEKNEYTFSENRERQHGLVGFYALNYILSALQVWIMATVTQRVSKEMCSDISRKINRLPMWFYNRTTIEDVLSRVTNDVDTIGQSLTDLNSCTLLWIEMLKIKLLLGFKMYSYLNVVVVSLIR